MAGCKRQSIYLVCSCCGRAYAVPVRCRSRLCPDCARGRAMDYYHRYRDRHYRNPLLVTLTTKAGPDLAGALETMRHAWPELLRSRLFRRPGPGKARSRVRFGIYGIEVKRSPHGWYLHLHALVDFKGWLDQRELSRLWGHLTGGASVVDVRRAWRHAGGVQGAVREVTKYVGKPADCRSWSSDQVDYVGEVIYNRRLSGTIGERAVSLDTKETSLHSLPCPACGSTLTNVGQGPSGQSIGGQAVPLYDFGTLVDQDSPP